MNIKTKFKAIPKKNPAKPEDPTKYYAHVVSKDTYDISNVAHRISDISSLSIMDVHAVLLGLSKVFPDMLCEGNRIRLEGLGTFSLGVKSDGETNEDDITAHNIKKVRLKFSPDNQLTEVLQQTKFEKVD
ncbi:MAG: HU family DNA-binding protein [Marinifilaceae bacterium]